MAKRLPERTVLVATAGDVLLDLRQPLPTPANDWLTARRKPGNWLDIGADDVIPKHFAMPARAVLDFFQLVFAPEMRRRSEEGRIDQDGFHMGQILQRPGGQTNEVRLNAEVQGMANVRAQRQVNANDPVYVRDLLGLEAFDLDPSELDAGHFTLFWVGIGWRAFFDFRSSRAKATSLLDHANEFLAAAKFSAELGYAKANVENLFNACELTAKAHLVLHPGRKLGKTHGNVHSAFNQWVRYGTADDRRFVKLYNRENDRRIPTRHHDADVVRPPSLVEIGFVEDQIGSLRRSLEHKVRSTTPRDAPPSP